MQCLLSGAVAAHLQVWCRLRPDQAGQLPCQQTLAPGRTAQAVYTTNMGVVLSGPHTRLDAVCLLGSSTLHALYLTAQQFMTTTVQIKCEPYNLPAVQQKPAQQLRDQPWPPRKTAAARLMLQLVRALQASMTSRPDSFTEG